MFCNLSHITNHEKSYLEYALETKNENTSLKKQFLERVNNNSEAFFIIHSGIEKNLPIHCHNKHQLYYLEGGIAFFNTPSASYFVPAHHFLWIPAGLEHSITFRTSVKMVHNIYIPVSLLTNGSRLADKAGIYPATNLLVEMIYYSVGWNEEIGPELTTQYQFLVALKNIITEVANTPLPIELPTTEDENLRLVLKYIHDNIDQPLSLYNTALKFGYSSRTLSRMFRNSIHTSFLQYVKLTRIIKGMELLLQTDLSVSEVSFSCGYTNLSSFSYAFQKIAHISPAVFRKKTRQI